jgi:hypothetical protein
MTAVHRRRLRTDRRAARACTVVALLTMLVAACGSGQAQSPTTSAAQAVTTTTTAESTRTTVAWAPGAPLQAWDTFLKTFDVKDASDVSISECGVYAMLVTDESLTFYMWNGVEWKDISEDLGGARGQYPIKVYTQDFTNDGTKDFFVVYRTKKNSGKVFGAYFAFPWGGKNTCVWSWVDVDDGRSFGKLVESPKVNQKKHVVYGDGYHRRYLTRGVYEYLPASSAFVFRIANVK